MGGDLQELGLQSERGVLDHNVGAMGCWGEGQEGTEVVVAVNVPFVGEAEEWILRLSGCTVVFVFVDFAYVGVDLFVIDVVVI